MISVVRFLFAFFVFLALFFLLLIYPYYTLGVMLLAIVAVGIYDLIQTDSAILRNFPVIGHFRYILMGIAPEIHQYFVENDTDGRPLTRLQRNYVYTRAEKKITSHPFGTERDLQKDDIEWVRHSMYPSPHLSEAPRTIIGGPNCKQPYSASLFNISAMSYGSLSKNAIQALNLGAKAGNFYHNSGEGSVSPYHKMGGDVCYQIGTGYFGCRSEDGGFSAEKFKETVSYEGIKLIELKLSQGAKPGHGGILPAKKNTEEIAEIRGVEPHTQVNSPPGHKVFSSAKGLLDFIQQLRELSGGRPIGFKICIGNPNEFEEICKQMKITGIKPDFITVDGAEGGTGAAPIIFSDHVGMPWQNALVFVVNTLRQYDLKDDIKIITASKIIDGFDIFKALCLGADLCNSGRGMMLALGCIQALECNKNTCPTGVATNQERLVRGLSVKDKWEHVYNYHEETLKDFTELFSAAGCNSLDDLNRSLLFKQLDGESVSLAAIYPEVCRIK